MPRRRGKNPNRTKSAPGRMRRKSGRKKDAKTKLTPKRWARIERQTVARLIGEGINPKNAPAIARQEMKAKYRMQTRRKS